MPWLFSDPFPLGVVQVTPGVSPRIPDRIKGGTKHGGYVDVVSDTNSNFALSFPPGNSRLYSMRRPSGTLAATSPCRSFSSEVSRGNVAERHASIPFRGIAADQLGGQNGQVR